MTYAWAAAFVSGLILTYWAYLTLPRGTDMMPRPHIVTIRSGPYKFAKHPMYIGNVLVFIGIGGLAAGFWGALGLGSLAEMLMMYWAGLEDGR